MKAAAPAAGEATAPIVRLLDDDAAPTPARASTRSRVPAPSPSRCSPAASCRPARARSRTATASPRSSTRSARRRRCARRPISSTPPTRSAIPDAVIASAFGASQAELVAHARKLGELQRAAQGAQLGDADRAQQVERVRKMLLAFSRDLRVVLLRLASRLQTLRYFAASKRPCPHDLAAESMQVFAPLANRLGIWQIKWEIEDLAFRFLDPESYRAIAACSTSAASTARRASRPCAPASPPTCATHGLAVEVQGRPKHLYSIWKKMRRKGLGFDRVLDVIALRVVVADVAACYAVLGRVHERFEAIPGELDDYIARPKPNGYRSLHTVVRDDAGGAVEIQIRTADMHEHAEYGVSAHWAYKEAATTASVAAAGAFEAGVAQARLVVLRQLLAWERDLAGGDDDVAASASVAVAPTRRPRARCSTSASTSSRRRPRSSSSRPARRRSTSPTPSTPTSAIAVAVRASTARWCRSTRR